MSSNKTSYSGMKINALTIACALTCSMASCVSEYRVATSINADGFCLREVYARGDSAFLAGNLAHNPYMFRLDSSWQLTPLEKANQPEKRGAKYNVKVSKTFRAIDEISAGLQFEDDVRPLVAPRETLQKRFRWFYTYYTVKTVYPSIADKIPVAVDAYMSREEQMLWFRGDFSAYRGWNGMELKEEMDKMEKRFLTWHSRIIYEAYFEAICDFEKRRRSSPYAAQLAAAKDTLFLMAMKEHDLTESEEVGAIYKTLDKYFKTSYFSDVYKQNKQQIDTLCSHQREYTARLEKTLFGKDIEYALTIPGKLVDANAPLAAQDTLRWKVTAVRLLADDYELTATSRKANAWAFAVVALLMALSAYCAARVKHFTKGKR